MFNKKVLILLFLFICNIVYAGTTGVKKMEFTFEDDVYKINTEGKKEYEILFKKNAARYHLLKSNSNHVEILKVLQNSLDTNMKISITIDPENLNILKVNKIKQ